MKEPAHTIAAGKFKATCLQLMDEVNKKHTCIVITKHGKPIAKLVPISETPVDHFGCLRGSVTIKKNIVDPIDVEWDATK